MRLVEKRIPLVVTGLAILAALATGFFVALGVRAVVAGPDSAPAAQGPLVSHTYDQIELPAGTWTGLDADTLDGLSSNEIDDADDHVSSADNASYATNAGSASTAQSANTASYATNAGSASTANSANTAGYATSAGNADTVDGKHANQIHDANDYVSNAGYATSAGSAGNADTVDGYHASQLLGVTEIQGVAITETVFQSLPGPQTVLIGQDTVNLSSAGRLDLLLYCRMVGPVGSYGWVDVNGQNRCQTPTTGSPTLGWEFSCSAKDVVLGAGSNVVRVYFTAPAASFLVRVDCSLLGTAHAP